MAKKAKTAPATDPAKASRWTPQELLAVQHMGPGLIGQEMYDAAQAYLASTHGGRFGPALLQLPGHSQAGPIAIRDGIPVFAEQA